MRRRRVSLTRRRSISLRCVRASGDGGVRWCVGACRLVGVVSEHMRPIRPAFAETSEGELRRFPEGRGRTLPPRGFLHAWSSPG